jgi:hypothetical protein
MARADYDMSAEAALIEVEGTGGASLKTLESFAKDCEYQAGVDERLALRFAANGNDIQAQRARWRANAAGWRQGRAAA